MKTLEYCRIAIADELPANLEHGDFVDAIACLNDSELRLIMDSFRDYDDKSIGGVIRKSIERQYANTIEDKAQKMHKEYQSIAYDDYEDSKYQMRRDREL